MGFPYSIKAGYSIGLKGSFWRPRAEFRVGHKDCITIE